MTRLLGLLIVASLVAIGLWFAFGRSDPAPDLASPSLRAEDEAPDFDGGLVAATRESGETSDRETGAEPTVQIESDAPRAITGRIVNRANERGIPGFDVFLLESTKEHARDTTDLEGAFRLQTSGASALELRIRTRPDWILESASGPLRVKGRQGKVEGFLTLDAELLASGKPLTILARRAPRHVFRGQLVDSRTGEPVPAFQIVVRDEEDRDDAVMTNKEGSFATTEEYGTGSLRLYLHDTVVPRLPLPSPVWHQRTDIDEELRVEARIGPTYRLSLALPASHLVTDVRLTLVDSALLDHTFEEAEIPGTLVRSGEPPWVRFDPRDPLVRSGPDGPWTLSAITADGLQAATAEVDSIVGIYPELVPLYFQGAAALRGTVTREDGEFVAYQELTLDEVDGDFSAKGRTGSDGTYRFVGLPPGAYDLGLKAIGLVPLTVRVQLVRGEESVEDLRVFRDAPVGRIAGVLRSSTGTYSESGFLILMGIHGHPGGVQVPNWVQEGGEQVARFAFEDVPAGQFNLHWTGTNHGVEPADLVVSARDEDVELRIRDDARLADFRMRFIDAASGHALDEVDATWSPGARDGMSSTALRISSGGILVEGWPVDRDFSWTARKQGYAIVSGDLSAFIPSGAEFVAEVSLEREE